MDKEKQVATLDLLDDQWGTLHVNDICRGVFHNIEGGNYTDDAYDDNGFMGYSGFATSYFTPTRIVESKAGGMTFEYSAGRDKHPSHAGHELLRLRELHRCGAAGHHV